MSQNRISINGTDIFQPDTDLEYNLETTYTADSTRTQDGTGYFTPMFTVQSWGYSATNIPVDEASKILKMVIGKQFSLYCFSPYNGTWGNVTCYVGKGSMKIGTLKSGNEFLSELAFNMISVYPI